MKLREGHHMTITAFERRVYPGLLSASYDRPFWYASVKVGKTEITFSRYDDETEWYADAYFDNGLPSWCHGAGSRSCRKQIATGALAEALNQRLGCEIQRTTEPQDLAA